MPRLPRAATSIFLALALIILASTGRVATAGQPRAASDVIVLVRGHALYVRDATGAEQPLVRTPSLTFPRYPVWSPDGSRVAYALQLLPGTGPAGDWGDDLYVVDGDGGAPRLLLAHDGAGAEIQGLTWMPDGVALLAGYQRTLIVDGRLLGITRRVERIDVATGARTTVVEDALYPSVSRDGAWLAYLTQDLEGNGGLWVAAPDGSGARQVLAIGSELLFILGPRISPDGSMIAFAGATGLGVLPGDAFVPASVLSPQSSVLGGPAAHGFPMDVWRVRVADGATRRLTTLFEDDPYPAWSPDGATLTVLGTNGLYRLDADGSHLETIGDGWAGGQLDVR